MTSIEVPDWVVRSVAGAMEDWHNNPANETGYNETLKAALNAALGAWVVPAGFMDSKAEFLLPRPGRCVLSSQTVLVRDAYEVRNLPLFTLRQEKPE